MRLARVLLVPIPLGPNPWAPPAPQRISPPCSQLPGTCRLANYAEWFREDTVFSRICRWSNDRRPASIRHSPTSYSAEREQTVARLETNSLAVRARASELVLDKTRCVKLDDLLVNSWGVGIGGSCENTLR
jgi:hypothetical protein